jgi:peptidoglycan/xylan/chitin deacetylase (PgdA/CDA1 family)
MRLATAACILAIVGVLTIFGFLIANKGESVPTRTAMVSSDPGASGRPAPAAAPAAVIQTLAQPEPTTVAQRSAAEAPPTALAQAVPAAAAAAPAATAPASAAAPVPAAASPGAPAATPPAPAAAHSCPGHPNALGVARTVEVDTTGGPGFGFEHFRAHDFLRPGEVVLTFDDGPWPQRTQAVLAALAAHCAKAIFFPIGKHATYEPGILKQVAAAGHAIGSHTWSHQNLARKTFEEAKDEIERGISAVAWAVAGPTAPYFRFPALRHPPELVKYLGERNVAIFSTDMDSFDFKMRRPDQVRNSVLAKLKKYGKGMVLMHDFQQATAAAATDLLNDLKEHGYKIVFMKPKFPITTLASYDELLRKDVKLPTVSSRPTSSVIRTISE